MSSERVGVVLGHGVAEERGSSERRREERALFARLAGEPRGGARDALVRRFLPLARHLARRYRNVEDPEDLEQVAALGLLKAIDRFDPDRGVAFSTFAVPTITGELKRHLRDRGWSVRVPRSVKDLALRVERVSADLACELGRSPTVAELAALADAPLEHVVEALAAAAARRAVSLDRPAPGDDEVDAFRREVAIVDPGFAAMEDADQLRTLMRVLGERDRRILELKLREDRCQREIGEELGLSQMQVSRLIRRALGRLARAAGAESRALDRLRAA
jgi:RNA polymerase sigma-B factor